jgi:hypothetical protein
MIEERVQSNSPTKDEAARHLNPYFHKHEMEIESGYPSESDAQATAINKYGRPEQELLNESKLTYAMVTKARAPP